MLIFRFPSRKKKRQLYFLWRNALKRKNFTPNRFSYICSAHFSGNCFRSGNEGRRRLQKDAVPTLFEYPPHLLKAPSQPRVYSEARRKRKLEEDAEEQEQARKRQRIEVTISLDHSYTYCDRDDFRRQMVFYREKCFHYKRLLHNATNRVYRVSSLLISMSR